MTDIIVRAAAAADVERIAQIWEHGWREAHLGKVPEELTRVRTHDTFVVRARANVPNTTLATVKALVVGFVVVTDDEVEQVYLDTAYRGNGIAAALLRSAEQTVAAHGFSIAWLAVVADNHTARRFYTRNGWTDDGDFTYQAATHVGPVDVPCRRYTKPALTTHPAAPHTATADQGQGAHRGFRRDVRGAAAMPVTPAGSGYRFIGPRRWRRSRWSARRRGACRGSGPCSCRNVEDAVVRSEEMAGIDGLLHPPEAVERRCG